MKTYTTEQIRNIAILGNSGSGKTTLSECMLFNGGLIDRRGDVASGNTASDYNQIEQENENSLFSTVLYTEVNNHKINMIDTPGLDDFIGGVFTGLYVGDTALSVINAQNGVEVGTEIQGRYIDKMNKPLVFAVNHLDTEKANFDKTLESLKERFGGNAVAVQYPVNAGEGFDAIIDLLNMKMYKYSSDNGKAEIVDIPDSEKDKAEELQSELIEKAAESDESLMEIFFENDTLTEEEMNKGIIAGITNRGLFPIFCISAKKNIGVDRLMDAITKIFPDPTAVETLTCKEGSMERVDPSKPTSMFVFKTSIESHIGEINYFKVISGEVNEGQDLVNHTSQTKERFSQLYANYGKNRNKVSKLCAGDIGASVKLKNTKVNHTVATNGHDIEFNSLVFPEPKYRSAIKPLSEGDEEKLGEALNRMSLEDKTLIIEYSKELKQIIIFGQGEYHLNILKWHLDNIYKIETEFIAPKIPYRETITKAAQASYRHKKQSGGAGQFGEVHMVVEPYIEGMADPSKYKIGGSEINVTVRGKDEHPLPWGGKLIYYNCIVGGSIDARFMPAILKGIMEKLDDGPLTGSYARDVVVSIYDGKMHPVDSNEISFKLAGRNAFREAFKNAGPKIMEPIYDVEVYCPADRMGDVMSDITGRRGMVQGMTSEKGYEVIRAKVPLAEMNKYSTALSSLTNGRATYTMKFDSYQPVPGDVQDKLIKEFEAEEEDE
jgi:elongation factor G